MRRGSSNGSDLKILAVLLLIALAALPAPAGARPGAPDPSFGDGGKLVKAVDLEPATWDSATTAMAKLPNGDTVVLAGRTLLAVKPDGKLARRFGGGRIEVVAPPGGTIQLSDLATAPGGRVLVAGTFVSASAADHGDPVGEQLFIARYRSDGSLDPAFGAGGILVTKAGQPPPRMVSPVPEEPWAAPRLKLGGIAVDADGRIVVTGSRVDFVQSCRIFISHYRYEEGFVARLEEDGALDSAFGEGGVAALPNTEAVAAPLLTERGGVYLSARPRYACFPGPRSGLAIRLGVNGRPVSTFGIGGRVSIPEENLPAPLPPVMDAAGRVLFPGTLFFSEGSYDPAAGRNVALVRRLLPTGETDLGFGVEGAAALGVPGKTFDLAAIAVDSKGRILVAGTSSPLGAGASPITFSVGRLTANGRLDSRVASRFGRRGAMSSRFGGRSEAMATSMVLVPGGGVLVAGTLTRPSLGGEEGVAMAQYESR